MPPLERRRKRREPERPSWRVPAAQSATKAPELSSANRAVIDAWLGLRRTQLALLVLLAAWLVLGSTVLRPHVAAPGSRSYLPVIFATALLTFAYMLRNQAVLPALNELRRNPRDAAVLRRWRRNNLIVLAMVEAVGAIGFAMQLFGSPATLVMVLYAIAAAYLFLLRPARP